MPWKDLRPMNERTCFVARLLEGERMIDLCREFGISRKTGYKFLDRFKRLGPSGLEDQSRVPFQLPHRTPEGIERLITKLREAKPTWGAKKLKAKLEELHPGIAIPAASTIGEILNRQGYIELRKRRRKREYFPSDRSTSAAPNDLWCIDFKGQFRLGNGKYCYPLTITDHYSRLLITCEALENTRTESVLPAFEAAFEQFGLPTGIRSDNGPPFASQGLAGLSQLSAWFIRLGIRPERIQPGHPEQNGRHERMHLTLKKETTRPPGKNLLQQQEIFDNFQQCYNFERPHEALLMESPAKHYTSSQRKFLRPIPEADYSLFDVVRKVTTNGMIRLPIKQSPRCFITRALNGHRVALREVAEKTWLVNFSGVDLGYIIPAGRHYALTVDNPFITVQEE